MLTLEEIENRCLDKQEEFGKRRLIDIKEK